MELEFEAGNSEEYKVEAIWDSAVYASKAEAYLPGLYYLLAWKKYLEEENTWEPSSAVQYLKKLTIFSIKNIRRSQQQLLLPSIPFRRWLGQQSSQPGLPPSRSGADRPTMPTNEQGIEF